MDRIGNRFFSRLRGITLDSTKPSLQSNSNTEKSRKPFWSNLIKKIHDNNEKYSEVSIDTSYNSTFEFPENTVMIFDFSKTNYTTTIVENFTEFYPSFSHTEQIESSYVEPPVMTPTLLSTFISTFQESLYYNTSNKPLTLFGPGLSNDISIYSLIAILCGLLVTAIIGHLFIIGTISFKIKLKQSVFPLYISLALSDVVGSNMIIVPVVLGLINPEYFTELSCNFLMIGLIMVMFISVHTIVSISVLRQCHARGKLYHTKQYTRMLGILLFNFWAVGLTIGFGFVARHILYPDSGCHFPYLSYIFVDMSYVICPSIFLGSIIVIVTNYINIRRKKNEIFHLQRQKKVVPKPESQFQKSLRSNAEKLHATAKCISEEIKMHSSLEGKFSKKGQQVNSIAKLKMDLFPENLLYKSHQLNTKTVMNPEPSQLLSKKPLKRTVQIAEGVHTHSIDDVSQSELAKPVRTDKGEQNLKHEPNEKAKKSFNVDLNTPEENLPKPKSATTSTRGGDVEHKNKSVLKNKSPLIEILPSTNRVVHTNQSKSIKPGKSIEILKTFDNWPLLDVSNVAEQHSKEPKSSMKKSNKPKSSLSVSKKRNHRCNDAEVDELNAEITELKNFGKEHHLTSHLDLDAINEEENAYNDVYTSFLLIVMFVCAYLPYLVLTGILSFSEESTNLSLVIVLYVAFLLCVDPWLYVLQDPRMKNFVIRKIHFSQY